MQVLFSMIDMLAAQHGFDKGISFSVTSERFAGATVVHTRIRVVILHDAPRKVGKEIVKKAVVDRFDYAADLGADDWLQQFVDKFSDWLRRLKSETESVSLKA